MALRYIDSMGDHYTVAEITTKWTAVQNATRSVGLHGYGMRGEFRKGMLFPTNTLIMEMFIQRIDTGASWIFSLTDDGTGVSQPSPTLQVYCGFDTNGALFVRRYGDATLLAQTLPDLIRVGVFYHIGWKVLVHPTAGTVEVRLNGEPVITLAGVATVTTLTPVSTFWSGKVGMFTLGDAGGATVQDDLVVMDDVADGISDPRLPGGGGFTKFLGPVEIKVKRPNGVGTVTGWTPTPAVPNWQNVDDSDPDADATYNAAAATAIGASDLFAMENLATDEDVVAVQSLVLARKTEEGVAAIAKLNSDGTTRVGPTVYQPTTYAYMHAPEPTAPDGSLWTKAKWDAIQYGYRRIV